MKWTLQPIFNQVTINQIHAVIHILIRVTVAECKSHISG